MTVDDLKAVLLSWRIQIPAKTNKEKENLQKAVGSEHKRIMADIFSHARSSTSRGVLELRRL